MNSILGGVSKIFETFCVVMGHSRRPINPKRKKERKKDEVVNFGCNPKCMVGHHNHNHPQWMINIP